MRISQFLFLPPFQRQGHGIRLYSFLYNMFLGDKSVVDFTVEDPNDFFQDMRDKHDVSCLLQQGALKDVMAPQVNRAQIHQLQSKFKLCHVSMV